MILKISRRHRLVYCSSHISGVLLLILISHVKSCYIIIPSHPLLPSAFSLTCYFVEADSDFLSQMPKALLSCSVDYCIMSRWNQSYVGDQGYASREVGSLWQACRREVLSKLTK
jgi:hypothetical protein